MARTVGQDFAATTEGRDAGTILVVDGVEGIHEQFGRLLSRWRCLSAWRARQALQLAERERIDVMLVHMSLPDGRADSQLPTLSATGADVICHTAYPTVVSLENVYQAGARHMFDRTHEACLILPALVSWLLDTRRGSLPPPTSEEKLLAGLGLSRQEARLVSHVWRRFELTELQARVLALNVRGYRETHVAHWLGRSPKTIEHHSGEILARAEVDGRLRDLVYAVRQCIVPDRAHPH